jgi:hypothetical protein
MSTIENDCMQHKYFDIITQLRNLAQNQSSAAIKRKKIQVIVFLIESTHVARVQSTTFFTSPAALAAAAVRPA